ncbi:MAG TPA: class I SAM-dependent methyltransferase [Albitalea sp.]|nr:class I SAM-dependent methyltransferase [Albitalea sp.]
MPHDSLLNPSSSYVCPLTRSQLRGDGQALRSTAGGAVYPVQAGIPQFLRFGSAESEEGRIKLARLNALALSHGWEAALRSVYGDEPGMLQYVTQPERASFIHLLPLKPTSDVLEIGPGLGQFTPLFARRARSVSALEVVSGQAEFVAQRCAQQGLTNVRVAAGGDDCRLPYPDASFDLVVLNLVFEWCASRCPAENEADVQRRLLAEMARVLRPGGSLYLATKNRFAIKYLIGKSDEHSHGMRFGSALPRTLWRRLLRGRGHERPGGMLHSHAALKRMIEGAGFAPVRSFWATPEMRFPKHYVPTDAASVRAARRLPDFVQGEGRSARLLMQWVPAAWVKHLAPGLAFLATKAARPS